MARGAIDERATNLRIQPSYTDLLNDVELLLCGDWAEQLQPLMGRPLVITYEREAHQMIQGIACHELVSVDEVKEKRPR